MLEIIKSGGWLMVPILLCSVVALAISLERLWTLRTSRIAPADLTAQVWESITKGRMDRARLRELQGSSPLGAILAAGINNAGHGRDIMKESIEDTANGIIHELERYLNTLGTIAAVTPLLGLLGTVIGMIRVFSEIMAEGTGNAAVLAGGISEALVTTAAGLSVAIPTLIFHRYFHRRVEELVVNMEQESIKLVEIMHGERSQDLGEDGYR